MKNTLIYVLAVLLVFNLASCEEDDEHAIHFDKTSVTLTRQQPVEKIEVTTDGDWTIVSDIPSWLSVSPLSSYDSPTFVTITAVENNEDTENRETTLVFSNGYNKEETITISQLGLAESDPFIEFEDEQYVIDLQGGEKWINLTANKPWELTAAPAWLTVSPMSGEASEKILISASRNDDLQNKEAVLTFKAKDGNAKAEITIKQFGRDELVQSPTLPIYMFKLISWSSVYESRVQAQIDELFVNSTIRENIYLGGLVGYQAEEFPLFPFFTGYTFNPITVSTTYAVDQVAKTYSPSLAGQESFVKELLADPPRRVAHILSDNGTTTFLTHKQLYKVGMTNLGIKLDEIVSGKSYKEQEMAKRQGLIYCFKQTLFTLDMDVPEKLIKEDPKETDKNVGYVSSVGYGKIGLLVIETDDNTEQVKTAIFRILNNDSPVREMDLAIITAADVSYVYFDNDGEVQVNKNGLEAVMAYGKARSNKKDRDNIYPVNFSLSDLKDHANSTVAFSFSVE